MILRLAAAAAAAFTLYIGTATAQSTDVGSLTIVDPWTRATPPGARTGAGFLEIRNHGEDSDRLIAAAAPVSGRVEVHEMTMKDGTMIMRQAKGGVEIPPGETVTLAPGGLHIMFMGLEAGFAEGDAIPLLLTFEKAGDVEILLHVGPVGAGGPPETYGSGTSDSGSHERDMNRQGHSQ